MPSSRVHFAPILHLTKGIWVIGKIVNHEATILSKDEQQTVCDLLNLARGDGTVECAIEALRAARQAKAPSPSLASEGGGG